MSSINLENLNVTPDQGGAQLQNRIKFALHNTEVVETVRSSVSEYRTRLERFAEQISEDINQT
jgi:hypothetical protein